MRSIFIKKEASYLLSLLFNILIALTAYTQEKEIKILDLETDSGISDVFYQYHQKSGVSDVNGRIYLTFTEGETLFLSHIQFGKIEFSSLEVEKAIEEGELKISGLERHLLPVTVVQVRPGAFRDRLDISPQNKLGHDAGSLLEMVPAISTIRKSGVYGFDPVLRGFKYDQINLIMDGIQTASAACPNRMDPASSQIPLNMIEETEVLKGPHSLRYGNVFGGTVNFKSSSPKFSAKTSPMGRVGTSYESNGNVVRGEGVVGMSGNNADVRLFGSYSQGDDYTDGEGVEIPAHFNRLNWGAKMGFRLGLAQQFGVLFSNNLAKDVDFPALPMDLREDNTWMVQATHSADIYGYKLSSWRTSLYGTFVDHLMDNYGKMMNPRSVDAETAAETRNYGGRTELKFDFGSTFFYTGLDYRFESADGTRTREFLMGPMMGKTLTDNVWQDAIVHRSGLFIEYHWKVNNSHLIASGRADINLSEARNPDPRFSEKYTSMESNIVRPSLSIGGTRVFGSSASLGLWLGMASRSPGITERYINQLPVGLDPYEMLGNPDLNPEVNNQLDIVFRYHTHNTRLNLNLFSSFLWDYISSEIREDLNPYMPSSPGVRQYINIDRAHMLGGEMSWTQVWGKYLNHNLGVAYTYGQNQEMDEPLPEIPPLEIRLQLEGSLWKNRIHPVLAFRQSLQQDRVAQSFGEMETPAFFVMDAKVSWLISKSLSLTVGAQNLLDEAYYEHLARSVRGSEKRPIYSPGQSMYATFTIDLM